MSPRPSDPVGSGSPISRIVEYALWGATPPLITVHTFGGTEQMTKLAKSGSPGAHRIAVPDPPYLAKGVRELQ